MGHWGEDDIAVLFAYLIFKKKLLIVTVTYGTAVLIADLAFHIIINGNRNT